MTRLGPLLLCCGLLWSGAGLAGDWRLYGENTLRIEEYGARGNLDASPYAELGRHRYNEFRLNLDGGLNPYNRWRFQVSGVANDSYYRSHHQGWAPERLYLFHERGDVALPYRFEAGDFYAGVSDLTLRRSVKGLRLELQPKADEGARRHSLSFFAGAQQSDWLDFHADRDLYRGASWLWQGNDGSRYSLNFVHNTRRPDWHTAGFDQWVASLALYKPFQFARQKLVAEGEVAHFEGDATYVRPEDERWVDSGVTAALSGQDRKWPLSYSVRFERYGDQFRPAGAYVSTNQQSLEAHAAWRFKSGPQLQANWQRYVDYLESENPVTTDAYSVALRGPFPDPVPDRITGGIELGWRHKADRAETFDARSSTIDADLAFTLHKGSATQLGLRWYAFDDWAWPGTERIVREARLNSAFDFELGPLDVRAQPGITYRETETTYGSTGTTTLQRYWYPSLNVSAASDRHHLDVQLGYAKNATDLPYGIDLETYRMDLSYEYRLKNHSLGVSYERQLRDPSSGEETESWRAGVYWQYRFDETFGAKDT